MAKKHILWQKRQCNVVLKKNDQELNWNFAVVKTNSIYSVDKENDSTSFSSKELFIEE